VVPSAFASIFAAAAAPASAAPACASLASAVRRYPSSGNPRPAFCADGPVHRLAVYAVNLTVVTFASPSPPVRAIFKRRMQQRLGSRLRPRPRCPTYEGVTKDARSQLYVPTNASARIHPPTSEASKGHVRGTSALSASEVCRAYPSTEVRSAAVAISSAPELALFVRGAKEIVLSSFLLGLAVPVFSVWPSWPARFA